MMIDTGSRDTARAFFRFCPDQFPNGPTGRKLYRYFRERDLNDVIVHAEPIVLHDFALAPKMMNMEQFLSAALEQGVLARHEAEKWQRELKLRMPRGGLRLRG